MTTMRMILSEIGYRRLDFFLCLLAIVVAAAMLIAGPMVISSYTAETNRLVGEHEEQMRVKLADLKEESKATLDAMQAEADAELAAMFKKTKQLMRDLGFNLRIVHAKTDMSDYFTSFKPHPMPEDYIHKVAGAKSIDKIRHLVATLYAKMEWNQRQILVMGTQSETQQSHLDKKKDMGMDIKPGTVWLGWDLRGEAKIGDKITLQKGDDLPEMTFEVAKVVDRRGTRSDVTIYMDLRDAQKLLGMQGQINEILALGCKCKIDQLAEVTAQVSKVLDDVKVVEHKTRAIARAEQRKLTAAKHKQTIALMKTTQDKVYDETQERESQLLSELKTNRAQVANSMSGMFAIITPLAVLAAAIFVGVMCWNNVLERRPEIGVLRTLGKTAGRIAAMFLGKALLLGVIGGLIGAAVGYAVALSAGTFWGLSPEMIPFDPLLAVVAVVGAPLIAVLASLLPTQIAVQQEPAVVLRDL